MKTTKKDLKINVNGFLVGAENYDDMGAHKQLESIMLEKKTIGVKFTTDSWDYFCADVNIKGISKSKFRYRLSQTNSNKLIEYLNTGEVDDFYFNFEELDVHNGEEPCDLELLKFIVQNKYEDLYFSPLCKTKPNIINAYSYRQFGYISFNVPRTPELIDFIRENGYSL